MQMHGGQLSKLNLLLEDKMKKILLYIMLISSIFAGDVVCQDMGSVTICTDDQGNTTTIWK